VDFSDIFFTLIVPVLVAVIVGVMTYYFANARWRATVRKLKERLNTVEAEQESLQREFETVEGLSEARSLLLLRWQQQFIEPLVSLRRRLHIDTSLGFEPLELSLRKTDREVLESILEEISGLRDAGVQILPELLMNLALLRYADGKEKHAEALFQEVIETDSTHQNARLNLGILLLRRSRFDEAVKEFEALVELASHRDDGYYGLGRAHMGANRPEKAVEAFSHVIRLRPEHYHTYCELGKAYALNGELDRAMESAQVAAKLDPRNVEGRVLQQELLIRMGRFEEAITDCKRFLVRIEDAKVYYNLAVASALEGKEENALQALRSAIQHNDAMRFKARDEKAFVELHEHPRYQDLLNGKLGLF
jgi:tetratricopeptide (TPR) repeat protein